MSLLPTVSVIIPVYNAAPYLQQCLESVVAQTLGDFECICVDDGSTDSSLKILQDWSKADQRIKVVSQDHRSCGMARNEGVRIARGEYILFLDADDFFHPQLLEKTVARASDTRADIVVFNAQRYNDRLDKYGEGNFLQITKIRKPGLEVFSRHDLPADILTVAVPNAGLKLFRRDFWINNLLEFLPVKFYGDLPAALTAMSRAERIAFLDEALVNYRVGIGNTLTILSKSDTEATIVTVLYELYKALKGANVYEDVKLGFANLVFKQVAQCLNDSLCMENRYKICESLNKPEFLKTGVFDFPPEKYDSPADYKQVKGCLDAVTFRKRLEFCRSDDARHELRILHKAARTNISPKFSVLIPAYNAEKWIMRCLDSILQQTLNEIEVIAVDDGSTDNTQAILLEAAQKDNRITVLSQSNCGASVARNSALQYVNPDSEYIYFMDADDRLDVNALEHLYAVSSRHDLEILFFGVDAFCDPDELTDHDAKKDLYRIFKEKSNYYNRSGNYTEICSGPSMFCQMDSHHDFVVSVWSYIINKKLLEGLDLKFIPASVHEDIIFTLTLTLHSDRCAYLDKPYYHRSVHADSVVTKPKSFIYAYSLFTDYQGISLLTGKLNLTPEQKQIVTRFACNRLKGCREVYHSLTEEEQSVYYGMPPDEQIPFEFLVKQFNDQRTTKEKEEIKIGKLNAKLKQQLAQLQNQTKRLQEQSLQLQALTMEMQKQKEQIKALTMKKKKQTEQIIRIKQSKAYRLGEFLIAPLRKFRNLFHK